MNDQQPSAADLYDLFIDPRYTIAQVADMTRYGLTQTVSHRRKKYKDDARIASLSLTDDEIVTQILSHARNAVALRMPSESLLQQILQEQREQTRHLRGINKVIQLWGLLLVLGILLAACAALGIFDAWF